MEKYVEIGIKLDSVLAEFFCTATSHKGGIFLKAGNNCGYIPVWVANLILNIAENRLFLARIITKQNNILDNIQNEIRKR